MAQLDSPDHRDIIKAAGGPFRVEKSAVESNHVAPELFKYMKDCGERMAAAAADGAAGPTPEWLSRFSARLDELQCDPEGVAQLAYAYAAARREGFVVEPENPEDTPCGKPAAQVFDELVAKAVERFWDSPDFGDRSQPSDMRYYAPDFGFEGSDLRALWSGYEGKKLSDFLMLMHRSLGPQVPSRTGKSPPPVGSIEQWRAFLAFNDPLKPLESDGSVAPAATASEDASPEAAASLPAWVTAEDRWERLEVLHEKLNEKLGIGGSFLVDVCRQLFFNFDLNSLMRFNPEQLQAVLPHLIERARLEVEHLALFAESYSTSWLQPQIPEGAESVRDMPPHELVARCWIDPEGMEEPHVQAVFDHSIAPKTFAILRTYFGEEDFNRLDVDKIRFADQLGRDQQLVFFLDHVGDDFFRTQPLDQLKRMNALEVDFFEAVLKSPRPDAATSEEEAPQEVPQKTPFEQALDRLNVIRYTDREMLMGMVLNAQELGVRGQSNDAILHRLGTGRGPTARMVALQLIRAIPVERLAVLSSNQHAALIQHPELAEHLRTLERMPREWLALALNAHLKSLPKLDAHLLNTALLQRATDAREALPPLAPREQAVLRELLQHSRADVDPEEEFDDAVGSFYREIQELLRCPGPDVLCAFVEHCGGWREAQRELGLDASLSDEGEVGKNVALMVHREECRQANHLRAQAAADSSEGRRLSVFAHVNPPANDVWNETPTNIHSMGRFKFGDFLLLGYTPEDLSIMAGHHRLVARLVQFVEEEREKAAPTESAPDDLDELEL